MREVMILARWLARKAVTLEWKAQGRKIDANKITEASNV
jgi:hypothetical protein